MDDSRLLDLALRGDREAFGGIVERYQSLVCAVCYSGTGDLSLSEDLAQETFIAAWRNLATLREPGKLPRWLCGIARNLVSNARRHRMGRVERAVPLEDALEHSADVPTPVEKAISREDEALLWRAIEGLSPAYREPLVLYYRGGHSLTSVAESLGITEEAARQRLSRGRKLLKREVSTFVEETLSRTGPKVGFAIAVVAALPSLAPEAAAASVVAAAAKGGSSTTLGFVLKTACAYAWAIAAWVWMLVIMAADVKQSKSPRERRFVLAANVMGTLAVVAGLSAFIWLVGSGLLGPFARRQGFEVTLMVALFGAFFAVVTLGRWVHDRRKKIQVEDGTYEETLPRRIAPGNVYWGLGGASFGGIAWMVRMGALTGDAAPVISAVVFGTVAFFYTLDIYRKGSSVWAAARRLAEMLGAVNVIVVALRWNDWMEAVRNIPGYPGVSRYPAWGVILIILALVGVVESVTRLKDARGRKASRLAEEPPADEEQTPR